MKNTKLPKKRTLLNIVMLSFAMLMFNHFASSQCLLTSGITSIDASCPTCNDGSATVSVAGGTPPYAYSWTKDSIFLSSVATITGLSPGIYCITVTDANACTSFGCVAIDSTSVPANCSVSIYDSAGIALYAIITQGTVPFTYFWDSGETTQSITPAVPGQYCVTITDNTGCSATACYQFGSGVCSAYFFPYIDSIQANVLYLIENSVGNNLTYLWDFGDGSTSTQQTPTHTYNSFGTYNICLTVNDSIGGCVDIFCMLVQLDSINKTFLGYSVIVVPDPFGTFTGINNEENNYAETKIYPNPASSKVYLELTGWGASATITMFNAIGQVLSREVISLNPGKNTVELDLINYHKGFYFLLIDSEKLRETKRISKIN
ncbi:MAG: PKD domain-containing protein [Bacteroidetes bacterium]|nr:PKD domain-containing protein [Bacteroidota bacterium]